MVEAVVGGTGRGRDVELLEWVQKRVCEDAL